MIKNRVIKDIINQSIDGILYDIGLIPEQINNSKDDIIQKVIIEMKNQIETLKKELL